MSASVASASSAPAASYVGSARCQGCHQQAYAAWQTSQHRGALQLPSPQTVLGDFENLDFTRGFEPARFRHERDAYRVETLGHSYDVKCTFGLRPLQQYLLDVGDGHLQALTVAYDTRPKPAGGRWYQLQPHEHTAPGDELHWTSAAYNWNSSCADCHSTNLQKRYDSEHARYDTQFSELSVGCEACHGPGSMHTDQAGRGVFDKNHGFLRQFASPTQRHWAFATDRPIASLTAGSATPHEVEACAFCHAHRADLGGSSLDFHDRYQLDLLDTEAYWPDGQQKQETFEVGSFLQSKMYAAGVVCSDCHEPHAGSLRRPGNALCGGCHEPRHYDAPSHHLHAAGSAAAQCVQCHMPVHTFMEIDGRREHRFSVPRPDLTLALGVPNPCTDGCHSERRHGKSPDAAAATWAAAAIRAHFGEQREPSFGPALDAGRRLTATGERDLLALVADARMPAIARASALAELRGYPETSLTVVAGAASDPSPLVRRAFAELAEARPAAERGQLLAPLLTDSVRSVRLATARGFIDLLRSELSASESAALRGAEDELRQSLSENTDRPGALLELARLELAASPGADADAKAETLFQRALRLVPSAAAPYLARADFLRERGRDQEAVNSLEQGLEKSRDKAPLEHALGLAWIRLGDKTRGVEHLAKAYRLAPDSGRLGYVYAVALFDQGARARAIAVLEQLRQRLPGDAATSALLERYRELTARPERPQKDLAPPGAPPPKAQ